MLNNKFDSYEKTDREKKTSTSIGDRENRGNDATQFRLEVAIKGFEVAMKKYVETLEWTPQGVRR